MKRIHFASLIILLVAVFTFSSCLDSDSESNWDYAGYMTVDNLMGTYILKPDFSSYTFIPSNPDKLQFVDKENNPTGEYLKRGFIVIKFAEEEVFPQEGKERYNVNIVSVERALNVKEMKKPELVEESNPLYQLGGKNQFWADNGYVNVSFYPTYEQGKADELDINDFDLFLDKVSDDNKTLFLRFNHSIAKVEKPINHPYLELTSFKLPSRGQIQNEFPDLEFFGSKNDSVRVKVTALGPNERELESPEFNIKLIY